VRDHNAQALAAFSRPGLSRNWTTKGEDVLHPRLVRGRSLETEPHVNIAYSGSLVCSVMNTKC
jgi:hypothetical protein